MERLAPVEVMRKDMFVVADILEMSCQLVVSYGRGRVMGAANIRLVVALLLEWGKRPHIMAGTMSTQPSSSLSSF